MFRSRWLHNVLAVVRSHKDRRRLTIRSCKRVRPMLEPLEDRITPSNFQTFYSFTGGSDGKGPQGGVILDSSGNLYGTTAGGTLFEISSKGTFTKLYSFTNAAGSDPLDAPIRDSSGNLYGTTYLNGVGQVPDGTVFEYSANGTYTTLHGFAFGTDGDGPRAGLIMDNKGDLFGTTWVGSANGGGSVFELSPDGSGGYNFTTLYSFGLDFQIYSGVVMDSAGNLYGTTYQGGSDRSNSGVVYKLSPDGSGGYTYSTLHTFTDGSDGGNPIGGLVLDGKGNLYGTTSGLGTGGGGTVFKLSTDGSSFTTLYSFPVDGSAGANPQDTLLLDSKGNLYGTTYQGGASNDGVVFELSPNGNGGYTNTTLHTFVGSDGANPYAGLVADGNGNLYGTTVNGGTNSAGTVFELTGVLPTGLAPTVTTNPRNQTVTAGQSATFTAAASGSPTPTVQWQVRSNGATTWTDISGATSTTLTLNNVLLSQNGNEYQAVFTNSVGSATTTAATLTVNPAPPPPPLPIITSGNSATFTIGQGGSFTVAATGGLTTSTLTESGALPSGIAFTDNGNGTATLHGTPAPGTNGTYHFTISATDSGGSVYQSFTLTVNPAPAPPTPPRPPVLNVPPLLAFFDSLLGGTETINANGTETITDSLFGITLMVATFDDSGNLVSASLLGFNVPNWVWSL